MTELELKIVSLEESIAILSHLTGDSTTYDDATI